MRESENKLAAVFSRFFFFIFASGMQQLLLWWGFLYNKKRNHKSYNAILWLKFQEIRQKKMAKLIQSWRNYGFLETKIAVFFNSFKNFCIFAKKIFGGKFFQNVQSSGF